MLPLRTVAVTAIALLASHTSGARAVPASSVQRPQTAEAVLQHAIRAKGGIDRLRGIHTVVMHGTLTVRSPKPIAAQTTSYIEYPGRFRQDSTFANGAVTQVYADGEAWMRDPSGVHDVTAAERDSLRSSTSRDLVSLLLKAANGQLTMRLTAPPGGQPSVVDTLQLSGENLAPVELLIDRATGTVTGERYVVEQPGAIGKVPTEESYSDYRGVDGVQVAFKTTVRRGEAVILERTLTDFRLNVPLDPALFKRPVWYSRDGVAARLTLALPTCLSTYLISCGEASGDLYAAALASELARVDPASRVLGLGGQQLRASGASPLEDYRDLTVTGLIEALAVLPRSWQTYRRLVQAARASRPDVFVAIDFPDFNFRLAAAMRRLGVPIVYYVCPQVWAWRRSRLRTLKRLVDRALVIFPFEEAIYQEQGIPVTFVGHPLLDLAHATVPRADFLSALRLDPCKPTIALLPGSRPNEVRTLAPVLADALPLIAARVPGVQFVVARAPGLPAELFAPLTGMPDPPAMVTSDADNVIAGSDVVLTCSGTATVQTAIHEKPMVIMYRLSPLTYRLGKRFVHVDTYGMVNLVAGERIVPELIQDGLSPERVAEEAASFLTNTERYGRTVAAIRTVRERLGATGATARAARLIADIAGRSAGRQG